jgi:hypothetical protein
MAVVSYILTNNKCSSFETIFQSGGKIKELEDCTNNGYVALRETSLKPTRNILYHLDKVLPDFPPKSLQLLLPTKINKMLWNGSQQL